MNRDNLVSGTLGYDEVVESFTEASLKLSFEEVNKDFIKYLPAIPSKVLDIGCGIGQNSAALRRLGYEVVAIDPLGAFLKVAQTYYSSLDIEWLQGSLPYLKVLNKHHGFFDFILMDGVWHHLNNHERKLSLRTLASFLSMGGICAISLRNGPAGAGKHVFPTSCEALFNDADDAGLKVIFHSENQPSLLPNKKNVTWARVALKKEA